MVYRYGVPGSWLLVRTFAINELLKGYRGVWLTGHEGVQFAFGGASRERGVPGIGIQVLSALKFSSMHILAFWFSIDGYTHLIHCFGKGCDRIAAA